MAGPSPGTAGLAQEMEALRRADARLNASCQGMKSFYDGRREPHVTTTTLRCVHCGATWLSESPQRLLERSEGCLRCGGTLVMADGILAEHPPERPVLAVTRATSALGQKVAFRLAALGVTQRLLVDSGMQIPRIEGAEVTKASYDKQAEMRRAFDGIEIVLLVSARETDPEVLRQQQVAAIDAAAAAGVERIVYVSVLAAAADATYVFAQAHFGAEQRARAAGMDYTFLRPSLNFDVLPSLCSLDGVISNGAGEGRTACVSRDDVAEVTVVVLASAGHNGHAYDVTGSQAQTMSELAAQLAVATGRPISYVRDELAQAPSRTAAIDPWESCFAGIAADEMSTVSDTVRTLTRHDPQTFPDFLRRHPERYRHLLA